jgi:hypothetical protein
MDFVNLGTSLIETDLSRKAREDEILWHEQDVKFMEDQRAWHDIYLSNRRDDMAWRREELFQRDLHTRMREIDEKNETLKNTGNVAALLAGFSMSALVQISPDEDTPNWLISIYAAMGALVICMMSFCFITCSLILVGTLRKFEVKESEAENLGTRFADEIDPKEQARLRQERRTRFTMFWETTCENDFHRAYLAFSFGVPLFIVNTAIATWVKFNNNLIWPGTLVSVICGTAILIMFCTLQMKWGTYLAATKHHNENQSSSPDQLREASAAVVDEEA